VKTRAISSPSRQWLLLAGALLLAGPAWGQSAYLVASGPYWVTNPPTYSCLEACALVFGGVPANYACSTSPSTINHMAYVDGYADSSHCSSPVSETYKLNTFYNCGSFGCAYSAYVQDNCYGTTNYCYNTYCGNGVLDPGEQCDDGNLLNGDCCSSGCQFEPSGNACENDLSPCTRDVCDGAGTCTHSPTPGCDHFTCYRASPVAGSPPFSPVSATLVDQFGNRAVGMTRPQFLCAPTDKSNEDPSAPTHPDHLKSYQIKPAVKATLPPHQVVANQFGTITVDPKKPTHLMVPSAKSLTANPPAPTSPAVDHFECYQVKVAKGTPKFAPIPGVTLQDQFGSLTVSVRKPKRLCTPVDKNGEEPGAETHPVHMMCYQITQTSLPKFSAVTPIYVNNQFGPEVLTASKPAELCVPSFKNGTCGNGVLEPGEQCEPAGGECCDATCHFKGSGTACSSDGNQCTNDVCSGSSAHCTHQNNTASCDDGVFCNGTDTCGNGTCKHSGDPCAAGAECNNICNEATDSCLSPSGTACSSDGNVCTDDVCDGMGMCTHPNNTAPCDDAIFCNGVDVCAGGSCTHPGDPCVGGGECGNVCNEGAGNCFIASGTPCTPDSDPCTDDVCDGAGNCGINTCLFTFSGVLTNTPEASLTGWTLCYSDTYDNSSTTLSDILTACSQAKLLLACRVTGSGTLQVLANAPQADVIFDTDATDTPHDANGVGWYYSNNYSWGFAPQGDPISRTSCDTVASSIGSPGPDPDKRLCWHTGSGNINGGWRCGADDSLNFSTGFERRIYQAP
jgi:cysteine-rich repeat protein